MRSTASLILLVLSGCSFSSQEGYYDSDWDPPKVSSVSPDGEEGNVGTGTATISGSKFGEDASKIVVQFGDENAKILSLTDTSIEVEVPAGPLTGGKVDIRVATETGFVVADDAYDYDVGPYQDEASYVQVNNFFESCYGGLSSRLDDEWANKLGALPCQDIAYIGQAGLDGAAERLNFKYPRFHGSSIGFYGGADLGGSDWKISRPGSLNFPSGIDDLHEDLGQVTLRQPAKAGDTYCSDLDALAEFRYGGGAPTYVNEDGETVTGFYSGSSVQVSSLPVAYDGDSCPDRFSYDLGEMAFCAPLPEDGIPSYVYQADWPIPLNFFDPNGDLEPAEVELSVSKVGIESLPIVLPEPLVVHVTEGMAYEESGFTNTRPNGEVEVATDLWSLAPIDPCFDDNGDGETLDDVAFRLEWQPSQAELPEVGGEIKAIESYVRVTLTSLSLTWLGPTAYPVRATITVPDNAGADTNDGTSFLEIPASVLQQFPDVDAAVAPSASNPNAGFLVITVERVTDYVVDTAGRTDLVFSYVTGDFGFFSYSSSLSEGSDCAAATE